MKGKFSDKILAIDPGTRYIGFALLNKGQLVHYGVKTILQATSPQETLKQGRKIILRLINDCRPHVVVVEKTFLADNRNSALLNVLSDEIKAVGKRRGLSVRCLAANIVRKHVCGNGAASKDDVARAVVSDFSELKPYLTSDRRWKERYHRNIFDAVALGLAVKVTSRRQG